MKKSIITLLVLFSFLIFVSGTAFSDMGKDKHEGAVFDKHHRLSEVIGSDVVNHQGEDLGSVDDLVANEDGKIDYLILSKGGVMGIGADLIAIPLEAVSPRMNEDGKISINVDKNTLETASTFSAGNYPDFSDRQWQQESRGYFDNDKTSPGAKERSPGMQQDGTMTTPKAGDPATPKKGTQQ